MLLNRGTSTSSDQGVGDRCGANLGPAACGLCCLKEREPGGALDREHWRDAGADGFSVGYAINRKILVIRCFL